jgi:hypothetical protein
VSKAIQKAFIEVNEEGSEAAAATGFGIMPLSVYIPDEVTLKVDHPFVAVIHEERTIASLFYSIVINPTEEMGLSQRRSASDAPATSSFRSFWLSVFQMSLLAMGIFLL